MEFVPFAKIPRLKREITVTEKIDGTNASISVAPMTVNELDDPTILGALATEGAVHALRAGSRTRWITPEDDNFGFAAWVKANGEELFKLGPGHHFGEWWGGKIQRGYGRTEKTFSLFNVDRWGAHNPNTPACCSVVPLLGRGDWLVADTALEDLRGSGSFAAPGFMKPEGIVVWHAASRAYFKVTLDKDEAPKGAA